MSTQRQFLLYECLAPHDLVSARNAAPHSQKFTTSGISLQQQIETVTEPNWIVVNRKNSGELKSPGIYFGVAFLQISFSRT